MNDTITLTAEQFKTWMAMLAPEPSELEIKFQIDRDISANPHNDYHKPKRRSRLEIIAEYKIRYAQAIHRAKFTREE